MGVSDSRWSFGTLPRGARDLITDVPGVLVGQVTLSGEGMETGVTAVLPHSGNLFRSKVPAAVHVINGFGKSAGLMQVQEMGTIESPILLTNTFAVGTAIDGALTWLLEQNPEIGDTTGTVNPLVLECNDGGINHIRQRRITQAHVLEAIAQAADTFQEGAVGGGRGMRCYGLKGGIGSASRLVTVGEETYTVGALLMTNFGAKADLTVCGEPIGRQIATGEREVDKGSVIVILATDAPVTCRQLGRCARRAQNGLARTGSCTGNGSGEVVVMFSTQNKLLHFPEQPVVHGQWLHDDKLEGFFRAVTECVEESVISSLLHAQPMTDRRGNVVHSLSEYL